MITKRSLLAAELMRNGLMAEREHGRESGRLENETKVTNDDSGKGKESEDEKMKGEGWPAGRNPKKVKGGMRDLRRYPHCRAVSSPSSVAWG